MAWIQFILGLAFAIMSAVIALTPLPDKFSSPRRPAATRPAGSNPTAALAALFQLAEAREPRPAKTEAVAVAAPLEHINMYYPSAPTPPPAAPVGRESQSAATSLRPPPGAASATAWANVPPEYVPDAVFPAAPARGIKVAARGSHVRDRKKDDGWTSYSQKTTTYGVALSADWSVNATASLGVDVVDARIESETFPAHTDVSGYIAHAGLHTALWDLFPLKAAIRYGRLENEGEYQGYREKSHGSTLYGGSLNLGIPYLAPYDARVRFGVGLSYDKLQTDSHRMSGPDEVTVSRMSSESLVMPLSVDLDKDYALCSGVLTPSAKLAYHWEFSDSGLGVRNFNAAAAKIHPLAPAVAGPNGYLQVGVGLKLASHGGWRAEAGYDYFMASDYRRHHFKLELAKCF